MRNLSFIKRINLEFHLWIFKKGYITTNKRVNPIDLILELESIIRLLATVELKHCALREIKKGSFYTNSFSGLVSEIAILNNTLSLRKNIPRLIGSQTNELNVYSWFVRKPLTGSKTPAELLKELKCFKVIVKRDYKTINTRSNNQALWKVANDLRVVFNMYVASLYHKG